MARYLSLPQYENRARTDKFYFLHVFDHALYNHPDSLRKNTRIDLTGKRETGVVAATGPQSVDK